MNKLESILEENIFFEKETIKEVDLSVLASYSNPFTASGVPDFIRKLHETDRFDIKPLENPYSINNQWYLPGQNDLLSRDPFPTLGNYVKDIGLRNLENGFGLMERYDFKGFYEGKRAPHLQYELVDPMGNSIRSGKDYKPLGRGEKDYISLGSHQDWGLPLPSKRDPLDKF